MPMNGEPSKRNAYAAGIAFLLGAAAFWSLNGVLIKLIYDEGRGPHGVVIAFYRSLFAGLFLWPLARRRWHTLLRSTVSPPNHSPFAIRHSLFAIRPAALACVVFFTLMTVCFVVANTRTEAANAIILQYTSTFWIFGLSPLILAERPRPRDLWILALAVIGIVIIFVGNASTDLFGLVNALGAGLFYGLLTMMIRCLRNSDSAAVTVINNLGSAVLILPLALFIGGMMVSPQTWVLLVVIGVVQFGLPYYLFTLGLARVPAYQAGLITLLEPVLVPIWTYLALSEEVPPATMIGGGVILLSLLVYVLMTRRNQYRMTEADSPGVRS